MMRIARLLSLLLAILTVSVMVAPAASSDPPSRLPNYVTDNAGALDPAGFAQVQSAVDELYADKRIRLWVVYVDDFSGQSPVAWAQNTMRLSDFGDQDALLAVAPTDRAYAFLVPDTVDGGTSADIDELRRNDIEPALRNRDWSGAAVAAANGLGAPAASPSTADIPWVGLLIALAVLVLILVALMLWSRRRRRKRREAEFEAAKRVDPTDPNALAGVPIDALDDLSKWMVVDVDNAVRTSDGELALAVEEFGPQQTEPFIRAVANAKATLAQAFNVRQTLDDAIPESPLQRRDLLTRVVVSAAKADQQLDAQSDAFEQLRNLIINAPDRLDALTQQMVDVTARLDPAAQELTALHSQFSDTALTSIAGNVDAARERVAFADRSITSARALVARPAGDQTGLIDAIRSAESSLGQARTLLDAISSAGTDINRAKAGLPAAIADIQNGIDEAAGRLRQPGVPDSGQLTAALKAANDAVSAAKTTGDADPLGAFTRLTKADADLDRLLAEVAERQQATERLNRSLDQALYTAQTRIKAVSDFIDTRRGSIGPEARTRLAEASRQLEAAEAKRQANISEAVAHANGAAMLAAQAQSLANDDVHAAQRSYTSQYGGGGNDLGAVIGGIIIGNVLRGGFGGFGGSYGGSWGGGGFGGGRSMGRSTSYGGSSHSSGRSYSGGGGRF
jgi:chromosome segregation ATPase